MNLGPEGAPAASRATYIRGRLIVPTFSIAKRVLSIGSR
jgi:hypothetical protein